MRQIRFPDFEPLVGSVISRLLAEEHAECEDGRHMDILREKFGAYRYRKPADLKEE